MERDKARKQEKIAQAAEQKVADMTLHCEKLMSALRIQNQNRNKTLSEQKGVAKQLAKSEEKCKLLQKKNAVTARVILQLKEQAEMLAGQLQLGDTRYTEMRDKMLQERRRRERMEQRHQQDLLDMQEKQMVALVCLFARYISVWAGHEQW